ncbi:T7 tail fiber protein [Enterobacter cloacae]|nr:T7 tail fiber protein [Enterobacter cloacae]
MATQPTNLPVPSESPRDLKFNAGKIDEFATSMGWTYTDRFGNQHYTIEGMRWLAQQAISAFGYITMDSFEDGNTLTLPNQVLRLEATGEYYRWDGPFPKDVPENSTPDTTGGIGAGKWLSVGDATLRPLVEVTANVVGTNNYSNLPGIGGTLASGSDYLYNGILYTTVGESGVIQSVSGNVVLTDNGNAYLLDKRWPVNDARAWGVKSGIDSTEAFQTAGTFLIRNLPEVTSLYVPPIQLHISQVELRDVSNFNIHFDGTYILGTATTSKSSIIKVVNAIQFTTSGSFIIEAVNSSNYTYAIELTAGLPSLIAPLTGIMTQVHVASPGFRKFPCAVRVGDGSDLKISEILITDILSNSCNCIIEANGSQVIVNTSGNLMVEPQPGFTYPAGCANCIGGIVYHNGGELVTSVGGSESAIAIIKQSREGANKFLI